jgi:prevent-host-death family protein
MKAVGISQFRAHTMEILEQISQAQENIIITRRGKPLARIIPYHDMDTTPRPGRLANTLVFEKDIVSPLGLTSMCKVFGNI